MKRNSDTFSLCERLVRENKAEEALKHLLKIADNDADKQSISLIIAKLKRFSRNEINGTIYSEEKEVSMNKINQSILSIIQQLRKTEQLSQKKNFSETDTESICDINKINNKMIKSFENHFITNTSNYQLNTTISDSPLMTNIYFKNLHEQLQKHHDFLIKDRQFSSNKLLETARLLRSVKKNCSNLSNLLEQTENDHCAMYRVCKKIIKEIDACQKHVAEYTISNKSSNIADFFNINVPVVCVLVEKLTFEVNNILDLAQAEISN